MLGARQKFIHVRTRAKHRVLHEVVKEPLEAIGPLLDHIWLVVKVGAPKGLHRYIGYNAAGSMHLNDLDQPFKIIVPPVHLLLGAIF